MRSWLVILAAAVVAACAHDVTAPRITPPKMILLDSLRAVNDTSLPCCSVSGGVFSLYYPAHHSDVIETPGGLVPRACVIGVPDGVLIDDAKGIAIAANGDTILSPVCTSGEYSMALRSTGSAKDSVLSSGYFSWTPDSLWQSGSLVLVDTVGGSNFVVTVTGNRIRIPWSQGSFTFQVISGPKE